MKSIVKLIGIAAVFAITASGCDSIEKPDMGNTGSTLSQNNGGDNSQLNNNTEGSQSGSNNQQDSEYNFYSSVETCELNFDEAMAANMPLAQYIQWANKNTEKAVKSLKLRLKKAHTTETKTIELGIHDGYNLSVTFGKTADDQIKVIPSCKRPNGESVDGLTSIQKNLTKPYFEKQEALNYILKQVRSDEQFYTPNKDKFASALFITAKTGNKGTTPEGIFNEEKLAVYKEAYNKSDGYIQIKDIGPYIYNKQIAADDCAGTLTVSYVVASADDITSETIDDKKLSAIEEKILSGFKTVNQKTAQQLFKFKVMKGTDTSTRDEDKLKAWKGKGIQKERGRLLTEEGTAGENGWKMTKNADVSKLFSQSNNPANEKSYYLTLNTEDIGTETFTTIFSKGDDNSTLLVKRVGFAKMKDSTELSVSMTFCKGSDEETFTWTVSP